MTNLFGILIKSKRNTGQRECAAEIGISPPTLSRIENGAIPDLATFKAIRNWIGMEADFLLDLIDSKVVKND